MPKHFIIHLPDLDADRVEWAGADEGGALEGGVATGTLAEAAAAAEGRRTTLVLAGEGVLLAETRVPGASAARAQLAAKYALEEQLADDVERLHFALGQKRKDDMYPVAVIDRDTMDRVASLCSEADLRPTEIVPETLALPRFGATEAGTPAWTALVDGDQAIVRLGGFKGFVADAGTLGLMLDGARQDSRLEREAARADEPGTDEPDGAADDVAMIVYTTPGASPVTLPPSLDVEHRRCAHALELYASGIAGSPHVNLLQGEYSPRTRFDATWKPWRWSAALAAVLLAVVFLGRYLDYRRLAAEEASLDAAIVSTFEQALPGTRLLRPRSQMESALAKIGAGGGDGFTLRLSQIGESLAARPSTVLNAASVRGNRFDLDLTTDSLPSLDAFASDLEGRGDLRMSVQSTTRDEGGVRARVRIE